MKMIGNLKKDLYAKRDPGKVPEYQGFFKTGIGEYGQGDIFIGVTPPDQRIVENNYKDIELKDLSELIQSKIHEERQIALYIMILKYKDPAQNEVAVRNSLYISFLSKLRGIKL